jgi:hypothetical protein
MLPPSYAVRSIIKEVKDKLTKIGTLLTYPIMHRAPSWNNSVTPSDIYGVKTRREEKIKAYKKGRTREVCGYIFVRLNTHKGARLVHASYKQTKHARLEVSNESTVNDILAHKRKYRNC